MDKKGSVLRIASAIVGTSLFLIGVYLLNADRMLEAAFTGVIGVLLITISTFPFIKSSIRRK